MFFPFIYSLISNQIITGMDENEKILVFFKKKQANLSEIFKPGLITKTCNI
jgi:hypothetical protein